MRKSFLVAFVFIIIASCSEKEEPPAPKPLSIISKDATVLTYDKVKLTAEIKNFSAEYVVDCGFKVYREDGSATVEYSLGIPSSGQVEFVVEGLEALTPYYFTSYFKEKNGETVYMRIDYNEKYFETDVPIVTSFTPLVVSDNYALTVHGDGFNNNTYFYIGTKSSSTAQEGKVELNRVSSSSTEVSLKTPIIGAHGPTEYTYYQAEIQPCALYVGNYEKTKLKKIGDVQYKYKFKLLDKSGSADGTFRVIVYYTRGNPSVEDLKIYFGDAIRTIVEKTNGFEFIPNDLLDYHILKFTVPFGTESGSSYKVKVVSSFDEEFLSIDGEDHFTVN